jgi:MtaA/CmuA family methyltransferase
MEEALDITNSTRRSRFLNALLGEPVEQIPVGNVVSVACVELMRACGAYFPSAHNDAETMAHLAAAGHTILGFDTVMPVFSVVQEAAALGCQVDWGDVDMMPTVRTHPFAGQENFGLPFGWQEEPPIQVVLQALRILRREVGNRAVIVGKVMGPWTLSYHMLGMDEFLMGTLESPDQVRRSLQVLKQVTTAFARMQLEAGADIICLADHCTGGIVSPRAYRDYLLPVHQEITGAIGAPTVLHCCGNTTDRLKYFAQAGFDCYHFESQVRLENAVAAAAGHMTLMGNINNPQLLLNGSPAQVAEACQRVIDSGVQILAPECAVPLTTPIQNLATLVEAARQQSLKRT